MLYQVSMSICCIKNLYQKILFYHSENDIYDEILNWKKRWDEPEKKKSIASTIRNLGMLHWIKADFSNSLEVSELEI